MAAQTENKFDVFNLKCVSEQCILGLSGINEKAIFTFLPVKLNYSQDLLKKTESNEEEAGSLDMCEHVL